jgi:DNA repair exonuclease SbcCD ATPase subunit
MRRIELLSVTLDRFRSFRQKTVFQLSPGGGLKFITGDNRAEPRLGANGAGKSTIWDGVVYCCYGTSTRGLRAGDLVSWGEQQPYCATAWLIAGAPRIIERQGSPNRLLLDRKPVEQIDIDRLLGLSRERFLHSVLFGQAMALFIDLPIPKRGELLEEVLDLGLWSRLAERAGVRHANLENEVERANRTIAFQNGKLEGIESPDKLAAAEQQFERDRASRIDAAILDVERIEGEIETHTALLAKTRANARTLPSIGEQQKTLDRKRQQKTILEQDYKRLFAGLAENQDLIKFYEHTRTCPTCSQPIDRAFATRKTDEAKRALNTARFALNDNGLATRGLTAQLEEMDGNLATMIRKREFTLDQMTRAEAATHHLSRALEGAIRAVEVIAEQPNPVTQRIATIVAEREAVQTVLRAETATRRRAQAQALRMDFWRAAFKRVRLFMVKRVLLQLEMETAAAAEALGLIGWRIGFVTETETKAGTLRPGINVTVNSPTASAPWEAWSGGEGQRVRLAVALGLASLIQRLSGISVGFEVFDEPSAWLSPEGIEDLLDCLKHRADTSGKSIWLCDHRNLQTTNFTETWSVYKDGAGSGIHLISQTE